MSAQSLAFLACRLMALWFGLVAVLRLPSSVYAKFVTDQLGPEASTALLATLGSFAPMFQVACHLLASAFLFYSAGWLSRILAGAPVDEGTALVPRNFHRIGMSLVAFLVGLSWLPSLLEDIYVHFQNDSLRPPSTQSLVVNLVGLTLAVSVFVWAIWSGKREMQNPSE